MFGPKDYWDRCFKEMDAETYDFSKSKSVNVLPDFCTKYLNMGDTILDLGCGAGRNAHYLAQSGYKVFGVDIAESAIEFCKKRFKRFNLSGIFKQGTFDHIPFPDNFFFAVICIAALDHGTLDCAKAAMTEIRRVLVPRGIMLLTIDPPDQDEDIVDQADVLPDGTFRYVRGEYKGMLFRRYQDDEIRSLVGGENIISFESKKGGVRVIICY
jgi:ubiquinone/menaquinone biosynthesis C-methylase UbiE